MAPYRDGSSSGMYFGAVSTDCGYIQTADTDGAATQELVINPFGGNVGIGVVNPLGVFHINGLASGQTGLTITNLGAANYGIDMRSSDLSGTGDYFMYMDSNDYWRADGSAQFGSSLIAPVDFATPIISAMWEPPIPRLSRMIISITIPALGTAAVPIDAMIVITIIDN